MELINGVNYNHLTRKLTESIKNGMILFVQRFKVS